MPPIINDTHYDTCTDTPCMVGRVVYAMKNKWHAESPYMMAILIQVVTEVVTDSQNISMYT